MTLPDLCDHHRPIFHRLRRGLTHRFRHPGEGRKALAERATTIAKQCPQCPDPRRTP